MLNRKSFFAHTVESAIAEAKLELGDEALLVTSRPLSGDGKPGSGYEVVFEHQQPSGVNQDSEASGTHIDAVVSEIAALRRDVEQMARLLRYTSASSLRVHHDCAQMASNLYDAGFPDDIALEILNRIEHRAGLCGPSPGWEMASAWQCLCAEVGSRVRTRPGVGMDAAAQKAVVLAGPPGIGKTTTLAKLAVTQGLAPSLPTVVFSTDTSRVGGTEQLRCYCAIFGVPFQQTESPGALLRALEEHRTKSLVLIDTPGYGHQDFAMAGEWVRLFSSRREIEVQLVLTATARYRDLLHAVDLWTGMRPSRLIFTHVDESTSFGPMLACAMRTGLPISYVGTGQAVPDDIEEASSSLVYRLATQVARSAKVAAA